MAPMVLLRHETPDGGHHFDWMLSRADTDSPLVTFRATDRIDLEWRDSMTLERIADHRQEYLRFEGELAGGRGSVARLAQGQCDILEDSSTRFVVTAHWEAGASARVELTPSGGGVWTVSSVTPIEVDRR